jgi:hypothetical protein
MSKTATKSILLTALFAIGVVASARGCGGVSNKPVTDERVAARMQASKAACDRAQACGTVGPGLTYESYESCITIIDGMIDQTYLPEAQCKDIDESKLPVCISALNGIQCNDGLDLLLTLVGSCSKESLCVGVADAGSD